MSAADFHEQACARVAALFPQRWLRHYVGSKLRSDPAFPAAYEVLRHSAEPLLDVGCGVGLLPFYLRERGYSAPILGLESDPRKTLIARRSAAHYSGIEFLEHDVRSELPAFIGNVALLDVMHYLEPTAQENLLSTLAARVPLGGALLLRDAPAEPTLRFWCTRLGERFAQTISWNVGVPLHYLTRESIARAFSGPDFTREEQPCWGHTPFNNWLFTFRRCASSASRLQESQIGNSAPSVVPASVRDNAD